MRKILYLIMCMCLVMAIFSVTCFATDEPVNADEIVTDETVTDEAVTDEAAEADIFSRIYEFWQSHQSEIVTLATSAVLIVLNIFLRLSNKELDKGQTNAIGGINQLIEGFNVMDTDLTTIKAEFERLVVSVKDIVNQIGELKASDSSFAEKIAETNAIIQGLVEKELLQNTALMEVLSSVYVNSNALPQGVKDLVVMKRTENMRIVEEANEIAHHNTSGGKGNV